MKKNESIPSENNLEHLATNILQANTFFLDKVQRQINTALTLRNLIIGYHIVEYEQSGKDRAVYGTGLLKAIAQKLIKLGVKSLQERNLYLCRDFYKTYPQILQTVSAKSYLSDFKSLAILQTSSAILPEDGESTNMNLLLSNLSFSHFIELLKANSEAKRRFYEDQAIKNNWGVRDLKRAIESLLYERTGLSTDKEAVLKGASFQFNGRKARRGFSQHLYAGISGVRGKAVLQ